jgi:hypothetical protein
MRSFLTAVVTLLACAAPASAGMVRVSYDTGLPEPGAPEAVYVADPGQRNDVTAIWPDDYTVRVHDEAATLTPGRDCASIDDRTVECAGPHSPEFRERLHRVHVLAGDMDDVVRSVGEPHPGLVGPTSLGAPGLVADGGPGDDVLVGGHLFNRLNGGGGHDTLIGGPASDFLSDDDTTGAADADVLDGGGAEDTVLSYATRTAPVTVDLGSDRPAGEAGERDTVRAVEIAYGGSGDDRLTAAVGMGRLNGGAGDDMLVGRGEADALYGEDGDDVASGTAGWDFLSGGRGDDVLSGRAGYDTLDARFGKDSVDCGADRPGQAPVFTDGTVLNPERPDLLTGCTDISYNALSRRGGIRFDAVPVLRRRVLTLAMGCRIIDPVDEGCLPTSGRLRVTETRGKRRTIASKVLGPNRYPHRPAARYHVYAPLTAAGRRVAARAHGTLLTIAFRDPDLPKIGWTVRVPPRAR